jgi:hypothetical protein
VELAVQPRLIWLEEMAVAPRFEGGLGAAPVLVVSLA